MVKNNEFEEYKFPIMMIGGSLLMAMFLIILLGRPLWNGLQKKRAEYKLQKNTLVALEEKLENLKSLKSKEAELKEKNAKVLAALPKDKDVPRLFTQFESVASSSGVLVKQVTESTGNTAVASAEQVVGQVAYQVTGTTQTYPELKSFLSKMETALRLISLGEVDANYSGNTMNLTFKTTTYTRGEK